MLTWRPWRIFDDPTVLKSLDAIKNLKNMHEVYGQIIQIVELEALSKYADKLLRCTKSLITEMMVETNLLAMTSEMFEALTSLCHIASIIFPLERRDTIMDRKPGAVQLREGSESQRNVHKDLQGGQRQACVRECSRRHEKLVF